MWSEMDKKVALLKGSPVPVTEEIMFYPLKIREISDYPFSQLLQLANIFFLDLNSIKAGFSNQPELEEASPFQLFLLLLGQVDEEGKNETRDQLLKALNLFTKDKWVFDGIIHNGTIPLTEFEWYEMRKIVAIEFGFKNEKPEEYNLANEKAKQFKKKRQETEKEIERLKKKKSEENDFSDLISSVAAKAPGLNIINIWDITMFQMMDQLKRLNLIETYEFNLRALLAGADSKKIDVQHWTSKI